MNYEKLDIVLVDFPFTDLTKIKRRPAIVVKSLELDNIVLCQITTKRRNIKKYEIFMQKEKCSGDIRFNPYIYLDTIFTLHKKLIHKKIGSILDIETRKIINNKLKSMF